jgi:hypothetical protein
MLNDAKVGHNNLKLQISRKRSYFFTFYDATDTQEMGDRPEKASLKFILQLQD